MAVVKNPALSGVASGNLGAINYTTWKGMAIARSVGFYNDPNTTPQQTSRALMTQASQAWGQTLTTLQRESWNKRAETVIFYSRFGDPYQPDGYMVYMKWNMQILQNGGILLTDAPVGGENTDIEELVVISDGFPGGMTVNLYQDGAIQINAASVVILRAGPYDSQGRHPIIPEYRRVGIQTPPSTLTESGLTPLKYYWWKAFGVFTSGIRTAAFEVQAVVPF